MSRRYSVMNVVGARPNFVKIAPLIRAMKEFPNLEPVLVHTGQHYDYLMSQVLFDQLGIPAPDYNLEVGTGSQHTQTAEIIKRFGELVKKDRPDMIVVVGDVNSTVACALVAAKERIPLAHVEAGLRSGDRSMPEEINRLMTDAVSDLLFTTEESGNANLSREGVPAEKIFFVGNVMIDSLVHSIDAARRSPLIPKLSLPRHGYGLLTLHRPANVDDAESLRAVLSAISRIAADVPVIFPVHPRTRANIASAKLNGMRSWDGIEPIREPGLWMTEPTPYIDFLGLIDSAAFVITDSGGIQEETTFLQIPCLTFRDNTERPVTITHGTNRLVGTDPEALVREFAAMRRSDGADAANGHRVPPLWDGHAAKRIAGKVADYLGTEERTGDLATMSDG